MKHAMCEVKSLDDGDPNGSFEAVLSAPTLDRDGEVIDGRAFEPLPARIPIDIDHGMTVATTVGSGVPFYDGDVLKIRGTFSSIPRAQELRTLVTEGHVDRMSVTFMDASRVVKDGVQHIARAELLNAAFVPIPSNREATVLVAKAFAPTEEERKAHSLQSIHDLAVQHGATCGEKSAPTPEPAPDAEGADTTPETTAAAAPAAAAVKSPADVAAHLAAYRALAEAAPAVLGTPPSSNEESP